MGDDRAVSETLGFVLTFALVVTAVGFVSTAGIGTLTDIRDTEQLNSADRGMQGLGDTFGDLQRRDDPQRTAQLSLNGGQLYLNETSLSVAVWDGGTRIATVNESVMALEHVVGGGEVVYEAGAVFRSDAGTARRTPALYCRDSRATVGLITITNDTYDVASSRGGQQVGRVDVRNLPTEDAIAESNEGRIAVTGTQERVRLPYTEPQTPAATSRTVAVNVTATSSPAHWRRYFDRQPNWRRASDDVYECSADSVTVRVTEIAVSVD